MRAHVSVVTHVIRATTEATTEAAIEGEDLVNVICITYRPQMALPMFNIYTLIQCKTHFGHISLIGNLCLAKEIGNITT